jgi:hypothetical protein
VVQVHPDPPTNWAVLRSARPKYNAPRRVLPGAIAQLGERLLCKQEVTGSIPVGSTDLFPEAYRQATVDGFAVSFIRLLFNNSEEVKRIRFSQTGFVWV